MINISVAQCVDTVAHKIRLTPKIISDSLLGFNRLQLGYIKKELELKNNLYRRVCVQDSIISLYNTKITLYNSQLKDANDIIDSKESIIIRQKDIIHENNTMLENTEFYYKTKLKRARIINIGIGAFIGVIITLIATK